MFVKQDKVLHTLILPEHIWKDVDDPTTFVNEEPVGTGPYVLDTFDSQAVTLTARDDYWGGELAVPTLYYVSYADNTALTTALASGDADWAQAFIPNVQSAYLDKDPDHNVYWAAAGLGIDTMIVNTTTKPFADVAFRKAVNMVIDRSKHQEIAREGGVPELTSVTGLPTPAGDAYIASEFEGQDYSVDVDGAKQVLEEAGYTWDGDTLIDPDGEAVTFTLSVPQGWNDYVTGISLISDSVKELGVEAAVDTPDADTWWAAKSEGDFQAILHWTDSGATPYDLYSDQMDGRFLKPIGEVADFNFGRFDSPEATAALAEYASTTDDATRAAALEEVQKIFVDQVPAMPIGTRPFLSQYNTRSFVGWPGEDDPYVPADPTQPTAVYILTKLQPAD
jgi:peptide/nickel transport system substrate-binding protein